MVVMLRNVVAVFVVFHFITELKQDNPEDGTKSKMNLYLSREIRNSIDLFSTAMDITSVQAKYAMTAFYSKWKNAKT